MKIHGNNHKRVMASRQPVRTPASTKAPSIRVRPVAQPKPAVKPIATKPAVPPIVAPPKPASPTELVTRKYESHSWKVIVMPNGMGTDIIAKRASVVHFVQVATDNDPRAVGTSVGTFIQNAFSNAARPVRARVVSGKITLIDVNTGQRVILRE